ncbi:MAG: hypothetical protein ACRDY6_09480 [Acidimicrobiia bacterium]
MLVGLLVSGLWLAGFMTKAVSGTAEFEILKRVNGAPRRARSSKRDSCVTA